MTLVNRVFGITALLNERKKKGLFRECQICARVPGPDGGHGHGSRELRTASGTFLNFASNDYLGLTDHPEILEALREGIAEYGAGTGSSPLVTGLTPAHEELSERLRDITGKEAVLLFSTGFAANQALIKAFMALKAGICLDRLAHASMQDLAFYARKLFRFRHNDTDHLERHLIAGNSPGIIVTEGVFSMDGDLAPLKRLQELREKFRTPLILDDAHGFGVHGPRGHGTPALVCGSFENTDIYMGTLSKAVGLSGAFIAGEREFLSFMTNTSREYIYSTMAPAFLARGALKSLTIIEGSEGEERRGHLATLIRRFRANMAELLPEYCPESETAIQPVIIGNTENLARVAAELRREGIIAGAIRPPTVPEGTARLRITLTAAHREQDTDFLAEKLSGIVRMIRNKTSANTENTA